MINRLSVENFKSFQEKRTFDFKAINLLTGINGRGKSSLLQAILLIAQSLDQRNSLAHLFIQGCNIDLGNYRDIKNSYSTQSQNIIFDFYVESNNQKYEARFCYTEDEENQLKALLINELSHCMEVPSNQDVKFDGKLMDTLKRVHYVSADRLGPIKYIDKIELPEFIRVGSRGENSMAILAQSNNLGLEVSPELYLGSDSISLLQQTSEWMSYILEGAKVDIKGLESESSILYMLLNNRNDGYSYKPMNVGFGYSYVLPLIVAGLIAKKEEILIVENPEAHLHPRAQSRIIEFFSMVASSGVQVFIESHSEHILNGIRLSCLKHNINISHKDVSVFYFDENFNTLNLSVNEKGKIPNWPQGFFDQQEIDLSNIFKSSILG